jgi:hypothetical protein
MKIIDENYDKLIKKTASFSRIECELVIIYDNKPFKNHLYHINNG